MQLKVKKEKNVFCLFFIILLLTVCLFSAFAGNLKQKSQVPGYYRINVGQFQITALLDGNMPMARELFIGISPLEMEELLSRMFITGEIPTFVNAYLINTGVKLVLVDTGSGASYGPAMGHVVENLKAAGYKPKQIDAILITHAHPDHIGGLLDANDKPVFPCAKVYISKPEADFWLSSENQANAPEALQPLFIMAQKIAAVYSARGKWKTFNDGDTPIPGIQNIRAILTTGHTPGMAAFEITSNGEKLLIWGDIIHAGVVQFPKPMAAIVYDTDIGQAIACRFAQLEAVAADKTLVAGMHLNFPGIGHIRKDGYQTFAWVPVDFTTLPD